MPDLVSSEVSGKPCIYDLYKKIAAALGLIFSYFWKQMREHTHSTLPYLDGDIIINTTYEQLEQI